MKKLFKYFSMILCCMATAFVFTACNSSNQDEGIKIKSISVSKTEISLIVGENELGSDEFVVSYKPFNATQNQVEFFSYNENLIDIDIKKGTTDTFVVTAKQIENDFEQTVIGIRMHGNTEVQTNCTVKISKVLTPLNTPTNLRYDEQSDYLTWDTNNDSVAENGYVLIINGEQIACPGSNTYSDFKKGEQLTVQVKAKGKIDELDSAYGEPLTFMVLEDIMAFEHDNNRLTWQPVEGALGYKLSVGLNSFEFDANTLEYFNENLFINPGEHEVKLVAQIQNEVDSSGKVTCYCYNSNPAVLKVTRLSTPNNVEISKNAFKWNAVLMDNGALPEEYIIYQDEIEFLHTQEISYLLTDEINVGQHSFKVQAIGDGVNTLDSEISITKNVTKLDMPTGLRVENGMLVWDRALSAEKYEIKIFGTIKENGIKVNYFDSAKSYLIVQPEDQDVTKIVFTMGDLFEGDYKISIANAGDGTNTLTSVFTTELNVFKLLATKSSSFNVEDNKLVFEKDDNATEYVITLKTEQSTETIHSTENIINLPHTVGAGQVEVTIQKIGDSQKYITSSVSETKYAMLLSAPLVEVKAGVLTWNNVNNATAYVLKINGTDHNLGLTTSYKFENETSGSYTVQVKALGGNADNVSNVLIGSFHSGFSSALNLEKLQTPSINLKEGSINIPSVVNASSIKQTTQKNADGSITYYAQAIGDDLKHINSTVSQGLTIWQIPNVTNLQVKDGYLIWDEMGYYTYGASKKTFDGAYFELSLTKIVDGVQQGETEVINLGQNHSYNFNDEKFTAAKYDAKVRIVGNTGSTGNKLFKSSGQETQELVKLSKPELTYTDIVTYMSSNFNENNLSGMLKWEAQSVEGQSAVGYTLSLMQGGSEVYKIDAKTATHYLCDSMVKEGEYDIKINAYGNGAEIVDSGYTEVTTFTKLKPAKNLKISNDGVLSWSTDYNSGGLFGYPTNIRVAFAININGKDYLPYESLSMDLNGLQTIYDLREFEITDEFPAGTYEVFVKTLPINYQVDYEIMGTTSTFGYVNDLIAEKSNTIIFHKLPEPLGFRMEQDENRRHILTWTKNNNPYISGYEISFVEQGKTTDDAIIVSISSASQTTFDYTQWLEDNNFVNKNFTAKIRCLTTTNGYLSSNYSKELILNILTFNENQLFVQNGNLKWNAVAGADYYIFDFVINKGLTNQKSVTKRFDGTVTSYQVSLANDNSFVAGTYDITVKVFGSNISNYGSIAYLDAQKEATFSFVKLITPTDVEVENGIVVYNGNNDSYSGYNYNVIITGAKSGTENNGTNQTYELPQKYEEGDYTIKVQAMGGNKYLNSEVSQNINPQTVTKLKSTNSYTKNGILYWEPVLNTSGYVIEFSGSSYFVYDGNGEPTIQTGLFTIAVTNAVSLDLSNKFEDQNGNIVQLAQGGEYQIKIKAMGTNLTYLNANYSQVKTFIKRNDIGDVTISDGILTWKTFDNLEAQNGIVIVAKHESESEFKTYYIEQNASYYELDQNFEAGSYELYVQLLGNTNYGDKGSDEYYLNGNPSNMMTVEKLPSPVNARVEYSNDPTLFGTYIFDNLDDKYENVAYELNVKIEVNGTVYEFTETLTENKFDIQNKFILDGQEVLLDTSAKIILKVKALGKDKYLNSNYSSTIELVVPATPTLTVIEDGNLFTGKITWNKDETVTKYHFTYKYISNEYMLQNGINSKDELTDEVWKVKDIEEVTIDNFAYVYNKGYYRFSIRASVVGDNNSELTSLPSDYTDIYEYILFDYGNGSEENPFRIATPEKFTYIKYNLTAHYEIASTDIDFTGLDFEGYNLKGLGSENEMFNGSLNGNNKVIKNIRLANTGTYNALFNYIGTEGKVYNLVIENITVVNGSTIGAVASQNFGTIENIVVGAKMQAGSYAYDGTSSISPYLSSRTQVYAGGIVGYNMGNIIGCKNYAQVAPRNDLAEVYAGGITAYNQGYIKNCGNYNNIGGTAPNTSAIYANFAGGIVAYNQLIEQVTVNEQTTVNKQEDDYEQIKSCLNIGSIYGKTKSVSAVSVEAFVGGIVGYNNKGSIQYCYNDNLNSQIYVITTHSTQNAYAGGLVGYNFSGSELHDCYTVSNVSYYNSSTADVKVGTIIGLNKSGNPSCLSNLYALTLSSVDNKGEGISAISTNIESLIDDNVSYADFHLKILNFEKSAQNVWKVVNNQLKLIWE